MKLFAAAALLLSTVPLSAQVTPATSAGEPVLKNARVTVLPVEIPAHGTWTNKTRHDVLTVILGGGGNKPKHAPGATIFSPAGSEEPIVNNGGAPLRAVLVEFSSPLGAKERKVPGATRYCNPGSRAACVAEKYLFCTAKACVEEVRMGAGAVTTEHSHDTDHMIIAVSDYSLADKASGKDVVIRNVKSGGAEYTPAGINHVLTNNSAGEIHFVVVVFR